MKRLFLFIFGIIFLTNIYGGVITKKTVYAVKTKEKIKIDGILSEKIWDEKKGYSDFVQIEPDEGDKPTEKTVVWVAYDKSNLYIAAKLYDKEPEKIVKRVGERDSYPDSDWFKVSIDPYFDRRSGYEFMVNPSNSIVDMVLFNDSSRDDSWDGVWKSAVKITDFGWTVEIKIPFNQLNFKNGKKELIWGINFERIIKRKNEKDSFIYIKRNDKGYVSHFAILKGIKNIKTKVYTEIMPYMVSGAKLNPDEKTQYMKNIGIDAKINLKSNLKLNIAVNPDFGQVEVDPAVMNLTAYETYYEEKRPFFIEGANIFNFGKGGVQFNLNINWTEPEFFYSRRIGRAPRKIFFEGESVKYPDRTSILSALKLTGKAFNSWNVGAILAVTGREFADVLSDGINSKKPVEPLSLYSVLRLQKEFKEGKSGLGFIITNVLRDFKEEYLKDYLNESSYAFGIDGWHFLDKNRNWVLSGWFGLSEVKGSPERIYTLQLSPEHYFQRPDADYLELQENKTSLTGWAGKITLNKEKGNWLFLSSIGVISPGFDVQDIGFQREGDVINGHTFIGYQTFKKTKLFRFRIAALGLQRMYDFGGNRLSSILFGMFESQLKNFWRLHLEGGYFFESLSKTATRGGPLMVSPTGVFINSNIHTDSRKKIFAGTGINSFLSEKRGNNFNFWSFVYIKPAENATISIGPSYSFGNNNSQWIMNYDDELMKTTYGKRYIFGELTQKILSMNLRINLSFSPKLTLKAFLQPFIAIGDYKRFKELGKPKSYEFNVYGENGSTIEEKDGYYIVDPDGEGPAEEFTIFNPDFNFKSIRGTIVLRWEYKKGSNIYIVWTQKRETFSQTPVLSFIDDINDMLEAKGSHVFLAKITYRWGF